MKPIAHHTPDEILIAYAAGNLPHAFSLVVAAHVSMCDECRARLGAHQAVGGAILEHTDQIVVSDGLKNRLFDAIDLPETGPAPVKPRYKASGVFPAPVMEALGGVPPKWKSLGFGVRQSVIASDAEGVARLLYIPGGMAVPDHGHNGLELTLVLQGAFHDASGRFGVGDLEVANDDVEHEPTAEDGPACICLAATDANLRFRSLIPRLLQPVFGI